jgi:hypothetical protein
MHACGRVKKHIYGRCYSTEIHSNTALDQASKRKHCVLFLYSQSALMNQKRKKLQAFCLQYAYVSKMTGFEDQTAATNNHLPMPEMWPSSLSWCTAQACGYIREPPESARQVYTTWLACTASVDPSKRAPHLNARTARYGQRLTAGLAEPVPRAIAVDCPSSVYFRIRKQENGQQINDISLGKLSHK